MTNVAVVGIGNWGQNLVHVFESLTSVPICCHTGRGEHASWIAETYPGIEVTTDYDDVLADERVDAVAIATPIPTLGALAERALEAGKHVYVEKPMADTRDEAGRLATLADARDLTLFVGYIFVHHPIFERARDRARADGVRHCRLDWHTEGSFGPPLVDNLVCHPVSVAVAEFGLPERIDVTEARAVTGTTDILQCTLQYDALACDVRVDRLSPTKRYALTTVTENDGVYVATDDTLYTFDQTSRAYEVGYDEDVDPLGTECRAFLDAVETGERPATDGAFGAQVHEVLAGLKSQLAQ